MASEPSVSSTPPFPRARFITRSFERLKRTGYWPDEWIHRLIDKFIEEQAEEGGDFPYLLPCWDFEQGVGYVNVIRVKVPMRFHFALYCDEESGEWSEEIESGEILTTTDDLEELLAFNARQ